VAIILEYLVDHAADTFRGNDAHGPRKLLRLPNGTKCNAAVNDVLTVERVLQRLASDARNRVKDLKRAQVLVERAAVTPTEVARGPIQPPPEGEFVVDAPGARPVAPGPAVKRGS